jgi:hypothetical protein
MFVHTWWLYGRNGSFFPFVMFMIYDLMRDVLVWR